MRHFQQRESIGYVPRDIFSSVEVRPNSHPLPVVSLFYFAILCLSSGLHVIVYLSESPFQKETGAQQDLFIIIIIIIIIVVVVVVVVNCYDDDETECSD